MTVDAEAVAATTEGLNCLEKGCTSAVVVPTALHVMCICVGEHGHVIPMLNVAEALRKRGHRVTISIPLMQAGRFTRQIESIDCQSEPIDIGIADEETWDKRKAAANAIPFMPLFELMRAPTKEVMQRMKPQVVVCDFATMAGSESAHLLGIPLVVNWPGPVEFPCATLGLATPNTYLAAGGFHFGFNCFTGIKFVSFMNIQRLGEFIRHIAVNMKNSKVLVHSFFGLEPPCLLPPFIRLVGPVTPPADELEARFRRESAELHQWLHTPGGLPAVVITTGSWVELHDWQVVAFFNGVKKAGFRAVWGLKKPEQAFLPKGDDPDFWVDSWIPQAELLNDDLVKAVITHCGWGGTLECMRAGKPVVCVPFFGDQQTNAGIIRDAGCGELVGAGPDLVFDPVNKWKEGAFTADTVAELLKKVVFDPSYAEASRRMQRPALACGGAVEAALEIESSARFGNSHLHSSRLNRIFGGSPFNGALCSLAVVASKAALCAFGPPGCVAACCSVALMTGAVKMRGGR